MMFVNEGWTAIARKALPWRAGDKQKAIVVVGALNAPVHIDFVNGKRTVPARTGSWAKKVNPVDLGRWHVSSFQLKGN
jgi:hypothetical protein